MTRLPSVVVHAAIAFDQILDGSADIGAEVFERIAPDMRPATSECSTYQTPASGLQAAFRDEETPAISAV